MNTIARTVREEVPAGILKDEIERLVVFVRNKKRSPIKSEFAVLLYEAQRTEAFLAWGHRHLSSFVVRELGLGRPLFEKYKQAGGELFRTMPGLYREVVIAVIEGKPGPRLPPVSKLKAVASVRKRLGPAASAVPSRLLLQVDPLAARVPSMRIVQDAVAKDCYGTADSRGRETLGKLDAFASSMARVEELLRSVAAGEGGRIPTSKLLDRLNTVMAGCESAYNLAHQVRDRVTVDD